MDELTEQVTSANKLFGRVENPAEAVLDSRVLIATSEAGALKARQLKIDADAFDTDEFLARLVTFMGGRRGSDRARRRKRTRRATQGGDDDDEMDGLEDDDDVPMLWSRVGKVLAGESKRAAPLDFMCAAELLLVCLRSPAEMGSCPVCRSPQVRPATARDQGEEGADAACEEPGRRGREDAARRGAARYSAWTNRGSEPELTQILRDGCLRTAARRGCCQE